jgi:predicted nucleic acid-binding protein
MNFLDTSVLVAGVLEKHPHHAASVPLLAAADSVTDMHCLAESFAVLTVAYKLRNLDAAALLLDRPLAIAQPLLPRITARVWRSLRWFRAEGFTMHCTRQSHAA